MTGEIDSGYHRLESQINWYDSKSLSAQSAYKRTKYFTIASSAVIPVVAISGWPYSEIVVAILGALIAIFEGANHVNQWQHHWIAYRSTCEALKHEKFAFVESIEPYETDSEEGRRKLLASRVESLISTEHSKWIAVQEEATAAKKNG
ncbi:MAG: hypothetical protein COB16_10850 [Rhodobacteraceae bacterium]|nr:MAG: hypothetical protein COB16_10850 [Paracoccaceae bacterium]